MKQTPIHRALGMPGGELTSEMLDDAVSAGVEETAELDWKGNSPLDWTDKGELAKDLAAMANNGGGLLVFGVTERKKIKRAGARVDIELTDHLERHIRQVGAALVMPPLLSLEVTQLGTEPPRAVAVQVPVSEDLPHLIVRKDALFGAPVRNGPDTRWMSEREIEQGYRARFELRRQGRQRLENLYAETVAVTGSKLSSFVGVAAPSSVVTNPQRTTPAVAYERLADAIERRSRFLVRNIPGRNPLNLSAPAFRPGLRCQVLYDDSIPNRSVHLSIHDDGSVCFVLRLGVQGQVTSRRIVTVSDLEEGLASLAALVDATFASDRHVAAVDVMIGLPKFTTQHFFAHTLDIVPTSDVLIPRFAPIAATWSRGQDNNLDVGTVHDLGLDMVNQGGQRKTHLLRTV